MSEDLYYQHSGKFSLSAILAGILVGLAVGLPLAFVYSYAILYIPIVGYITIILSGIFGGAAGGATAGGLRWKKARNTALTAVLAFLVALVSFYFSWAVWIYALLRRGGEKVPLRGLVVFPNLLWRLIAEVNKVGAFTVRGTRPTGAVLWGLWGIEAAIILGMAVFVAMGMVREDPFCESCESWCKKQEGVCKVSGGDVNELKRRMESKDFGYFEKLGAWTPRELARVRTDVREALRADLSDRSSWRPATVDAQAWFRVDLHACPSCRATNTLSVTSFSESVDKYGNKSKSEKEVLDKLLISSTEADDVRQLGQKFGAAGAPAASS